MWALRKGPIQKLADVLMNRPSMRYQHTHEHFAHPCYSLHCEQRKIDANLNDARIETMSQNAVGSTLTHLDGTDVFGVAQSDLNAATSKFDFELLSLLLGGGECL